jgi:hypothetical protein
MVRKAIAISLIIISLIYINFADITDIFIDYQYDADNRPVINVLFIGNSHTFYNNMPQMVDRISISQQQAPYKIYTEQVTVGGATLEKHWRQEKAAQTIISKPWHYVILQDQSTVMMYRHQRNNSKEYIKKFHRLIKEVGAHTILYATWPRQKGNVIYDTFPKGYEYMQQIVDNNYYNIAKSAGTGLVFTSDIWNFAQKNNIDVYNRDGNHASLEGSYLIALKFYKYLQPNIKIYIKNLYIPKMINEDSIRPAIKKIIS